MQYMGVAIFEIIRRGNTKTESQSVEYLAQCSKPYADKSKAEEWIEDIRDISEVENNILQDYNDSKFLYKSSILSFEDESEGRLMLTWLCMGFNSNNK